MEKFSEPEERILCENCGNPVDDFVTSRIYIEASKNFSIS